MSTQLIFSNLLHIRKKNEADSVEKCFGFFFSKVLRSSCEVS